MELVDLIRFSFKAPRRIDLSDDAEIVARRFRERMR